jgi:MYXO-CTERM domain-containing protein
MGIKDWVQGTTRLAAAAMAWATLLMATSAEAALYRGRIDPLFGASIAGNGSGNLGWRAEVFVDVPDAPSCFTNTGSQTNCNTGASFKSADLFFYDVTNPTVAFAQASWNEVDLSGVAIIGILDDGLTLTEVYADNAFPLKAVSPLNGFSNDTPYGSFLTYDWTLFFASPAFFEGSGGGYAGPVLAWQGQTNCGGDLCLISGTNDFQTYPPTVTYTQVPEPQSLALAAVALLALAALRRRRPSASRL